MTPLVWLASYPKSGNTWVRFIVTALLRGGSPSSGDVARFVPDVHKGTLEVRPVHRGAAIVKVHALPDHCRRFLPRTIGAIYVVRNPLDVCLSTLAYRGMTRDAQLGLLQAFVGEGGPRDWGGAARFGSLPANIAAWTDAGLGFPRLLVRYEDLARDTAGQVRRIADWLGVPADDARIEAAIDSSSFSAMRRAEEAEVAAGGDDLFGVAHALQRAHVPGWRFMRRGAVGGFRDELPAAAIAALRARFESVMADCGYALDDACNLIVHDEVPARARLDERSPFG
jgi:hypothetical protein